MVCNVCNGICDLFVVDKSFLAVFYFILKAVVVLGLIL